jgi:hypothetical protein
MTYRFDCMDAQARCCFGNYRRLLGRVEVVDILEVVRQEDLLSH